MAVQDMQILEAPSNPAVVSPYDLPSREILVALLLTVPCLAYVFSLPYLLYHDFEPIHNSSSNNNSKLEEKHFMDRTVFTDFTFIDPGDRPKKEEAVQIMFIVFAAFGGLVSSMLADIYGRSVICSIFLTATVLSGFLLTQAPTFTYFNVLWSVLSFSLMGSYTVTFIRMLELLPERLRLPAGLMFFGGLWNVSRFTASLSAIIFRNWTLIVFFLSFWLCAVFLLSRNSMMREVPFSEADKENKFYQIFTVPKKLMQLLVLSFSWLICGLVFFGFNLSRNGFFSDSMHTNLLFPGLIDFLALILATVTCYSTRRTLAVFMVFMLFTAVCLFAMAPFQTCNGANSSNNSSSNGADDSKVDGEWIPCESWAKLLIVLTQISSLFTGGANWSILWLVTASTFPTRMRCTSVGVCTFVARVGSLLGILLVDSGVVYGNPVTLSLAGLLAIASGLSAVLFLPETASRPLCRNLREEREADKRN